MTSHSPAQKTKTFILSLTRDASGSTTPMSCGQQLLLVAVVAWRQAVAAPPDSAG